jgi:hypothetical protein
MFAYSVMSLAAAAQQVLLPLPAQAARHRQSCMPLLVLKIVRWVHIYWLRAIRRLYYFSALLVMLPVVTAMTHFLTNATLATVQMYSCRLRRV